MGKAVRRTILGFLGLLIAAQGARAEIRVFGVAPVRVATTAIVKNFTQATGGAVALTIVASNVIDQELPGKSVDVLILGSQAMDGLEKQGRLLAGSRVRLARTGIGVGVRAGSPLPDLATPDAFKRAMLAARSIVYRDTAETDLSGYVAERILANAGILDVLRPKIRIESLSASHALIAKGEIEVGLYNVSEVASPGVVLAGPVPDALQLYSNFDAAIPAQDTTAAQAAAFIAFVAGDAARESWQAAGMEPLVRR